jgi:Flp pilus assembly protein TadB
MTELVLVGMTAGLGVTALVAGLSRPKTGGPTANARPAASKWSVRIGRALIELLRISSSPTRLGQDLNVLGRSEESLAVTTTLVAVTSAAGSAVVYASLGSLGLRIPGVIVPIACLATGFAGSLLPSVRVRRSACSKRRALVHSLACWLELVALAQAGGMGIESALEAASSVAGETSFLRIRRSLESARHGGRSPWDALGRLGAYLGVNELEELAASVRLAGTEGARIRASLSAKSASLRRREMSDAQSQANTTTERLFLPAIVLMLGFVVFLIYPAAMTLSHVL